MARDFTKNTANYVQLGVGAVGPFLNGASAISVHAIVTIDTSNNTDPTDNRIFQVALGTNRGLLLNADSNTGSANTFRFGARSQDADSEQAINSTTNWVAGTEYAVGGVANIAADTMSLYFNGALNTGPTAKTFGAATYTQGSPTLNDQIGSNSTATGVAPGFTVTMFDGRISELAVWASDIGAAGFASLNRRVPAYAVSPETLVFYAPMKETAIIDIVGGLTGTITGTVDKAAHPRMAYSMAPLISVTGGGGGAPPYDQGAQQSLGSFHQTIYRRRWA